MTRQPPPRHPWAIAWAGLSALAVAMGIGRFAFTPLLPMMLHEGLVGLPMASWLATANYLGYLLGAMACALLPWLPARWPASAAWLAPTRLVRAGLAATVLLTLGMALPWPAAWPTLRLLAGVASAFVFVQTSGWALARLAPVVFLIWFAAGAISRGNAAVGGEGGLLGLIGL